MNPDFAPTFQRTDIFGENDYMNGFGDRRLALGAIALAAVSQLALASAANAQDTAANEAADTGFEIIVTAQKRAERLQDVPLAVSAVSGNQLQTLSINSPMELRYVAPSLNFQGSANVRGEGFSIRGVGTAVFSDTVEQSVGTVVDGVPLARSGQAVADLIDIERVEILRGPQGMLFGKNASAGVISITTKAPEFNNSLQVRASYATKNEVKASAIGNLKLTDTLAFRVAYAQTTRDGIVDNIFRKELLNGRDSRGVRARLLWEPAPNLTVNLLGDWGKSDQLCCTWTARTVPANTQYGQMTAAAGIVPGPKNLQIAADKLFYQKIENWGTSMQVDLDVDWATLTSISAYRHWTSDDNNDPDLLPVNYLSINSGQSKLNQYSQEFRITSPSGGQFEWVAGVFLNHTVNHSHAEQTGKLVLPLPGDMVIGSSVDSTTKNTSSAIFGQLSYEPVDGLKLIFGGRYTAEKLAFNANMYKAPSAFMSIPGRYVGPVWARASNENFSGRATLQYSFNDDVMIFASAARGYKGAAVDTLGVVSADTKVIRPEIPTSYEIGLRSQFLDRRVTLNVTGFATDFKDFQASIFDTSVSPARFAVATAGKLRTRGVEADFVVQPAQGLTFNGSLAYVDGTYLDFKNIGCYAGQPVLPLGTQRTSPRQCIQITPAQAVTYGDGNPLTNSPKFTYSVTASYQHHINDYRIDGSLNWFWRSKVNFDAAGNPLTVQDSYGLLNANVSVGPDDGLWRLSFFARNILNQNFANMVFGQPVLNAPGISVQFPSPDAQRLLGVALEVKFGGR